MSIQQIIIYILFAFMGYVIGRVGHTIWGHFKALHHWIYGLLLIMVSLFFRENPSGFLILSFGLGLFISDLKDFLTFKFYGRDQVGPKKFWGID